MLPWSADTDGVKSAENKRKSATFVMGVHLPNVLLLPAGLFSKLKGNPTRLCRAENTAFD